MAIMEFAYVLWKKRRADMKRKKQVNTETDNSSIKMVSGISQPSDQIAGLEPHNGRSYWNEQTDQFYAVDNVAQIIYLCSFVVFNSIYWANYYG